MAAIFNVPLWANFDKFLNFISKTQHLSFNVINCVQRIVVPYKARFIITAALQGDLSKTLFVVSSAYIVNRVLFILIGSLLAYL